MSPTPSALSSVRAAMSRSLIAAQISRSVETRGASLALIASFRSPANRSRIIAHLALSAGHTGMKVDYISSMTAGTQAREDRITL